MKIETKRLVLRPFEESDYDDLYEFLSQLRDDEFEGYPGITCENGAPIWKDTFIYAIIDEDWEQADGRTHE